MAAAAGQRLLSPNANPRRRVSGSTLAPIYEPHRAAAEAASSFGADHEFSTSSGRHSGTLSPVSEPQRAIAVQSAADAAAAAAAAFGSDQTQSRGRFPILPLLTTSAPSTPH